METNKILQADYLDLVFDKRNKNYGGYELRKHYNARAVKALGFTLSSLILAIGIPYLLNFGTNGKNTALNATTNDRVIEVTSVFKKEIPKPPVNKPAKTHNPSVAKTFKSTPPVIVENIKAPKIEPPEIKGPKIAIAGVANSEGNGGEHPATTTTPPSGPPGGGPAIVGTPEPEVVVEPISTSPDVVPEYPGGMAALLEYLQRNMRYPNEAKENEIQGRVVVRFIVNAQGKIEGAEVQKGIGYGCDKEALRVVNAMKPWKPGQVKGKAVKVYYTLPITFRLDR